MLLIAGASRGEIVIVAEEVMDSKYTISLQLSASHLDKKDFFGKVRYALNVHVHACILDYYSALTTCTTSYIQIEIVHYRFV